MVLAGFSFIITKESSHSQQLGLLPVKVVLKFVVASKCYQGSVANRVREKHLGSGIDPDLKRKYIYFGSQDALRSSREESPKDVHQQRKDVLLNALTTRYDCN